MIQTFAMVVYTSGIGGALDRPQRSGRDDVVAQIGVGKTRCSHIYRFAAAEKIFTYFIPLTAGAVVHFGESIDTWRQDSPSLPSIFLGVPRIWEKMHASITSR